jgi:hypothetical protein
MEKEINITSIIGMRGFEILKTLVIQILEIRWYPKYIVIKNKEYEPNNSDNLQSHLMTMDG